MVSNEERGRISTTSESASSLLCRLRRSKDSAGRELRVPKTFFDSTNRLSNILDVKSSAGFASRDAVYVRIDVIVNA